MEEHDLRIDNRIYSKQALNEARVAFANYLKVNVCLDAVGNVNLTFCVLDQYRESSREVILEFMNYVLDRSIQLQQEKA